MRGMRLLCGLSLAAAVLGACDRALVPESSSGPHGAVGTDANDAMPSDVDASMRQDAGSPAPDSGGMDGAVSHDGGAVDAADAADAADAQAGPEVDAGATPDGAVDAAGIDAGEDGAGPIPRGCDRAESCFLGAVRVPETSDFTYDDTRNVLYIVAGPGAGRPGAVHRWDLASGAFLEPLLYESVYRSVDLSPSQDRLVVSDAIGNSRELGFHIVDLETETSERFAAPNGIGEDGAYMAVFADEHTVLFSATFPGSGVTPIRRVDLRTRVVDEVGSSFGEAGAFARSANGAIVGAVEPSSHGLVGRYDVATGAFVAAPTVPIFSAAYTYPYDLCVSPDGSRITVLSTTRGALGFDDDLSLRWALGVEVGDLSGGKPYGCAYNSVTGALYLAWTTPPPEHAGLMAYDPDTLEPIAIVEQDYGGVDRRNAFSPGRMKVSRDGTLLFMQSYLGVSLFALGAGPAVPPAAFPADAAPPIPGPPPPFVPQSSAGASSSYQIDAAHTGSQASEGPALPLAQRWAVDLKAPVAYPVLADGLVFACAAQLLYALDADTGRVVWGPKLVGEGDGVASATYANGRVYAVSSTGAVTAFDGRTGARAWTLEVDDTLAPAVASDTALFVAGRQNVLAFDQASGTLLWRADWTGGGSPAVLEGNMLYAAQACGDVSAFDASTGMRAWGDAAYCSGFGGATLVGHAGRLYASFDDVAVLDATSGAALGALTAKQPPAFVAGGPMLLVTRIEPGITDELSAYVASGTAAAWRFRARELSAPVTAGGRVFVVSKPSELYVLDASTGQALDGVVLPASYAERGAFDAQAPTSLAISGDMLVVPVGSTLVAY